MPIQRQAPLPANTTAPVADARSWPGRRWPGRLWPGHTWLRHTVLQGLVGAALALVVASPVAAQRADPLPIAPEPATGWVAKAPARAERQMVATANTLASEAGRDMLRQGGSAIDAAIAAQLVLGLVEPQSSGLGGGGFIMVADTDGSLRTYDGRETAPRGTTADRFVKPDGKPMEFQAALQGGRSVGVPGLIAGMKAAHEAHGKLPWAALFQPAIRLAETGWPAQPRMVRVLTEWAPVLSRSPDLNRHFYRDGKGPPALGETLRDPAQAQALRLLATDGPPALYAGPLGRAITHRLEVARVEAGAPDLPVVTADDLAAYAPVRRDALCRPYRAYRICTMGPPSAGGLAVLQVMGLLERWDLANAGPETGRGWHLMAESLRRALADREVWSGDPAFAAIPVRGLLDRAYLRDRATGINADRPTSGPVAPGSPPYRQGAAFGTGQGPEVTGTTHLSVVDSKGQAVAMTTTVEFAFGSGLIASGIVLNNQLSDFSFTPLDRDGRPVANAAGAAKRPRSSMAPVIVFDARGRVVAVVGSPGGASIIAYVTKTLVGLLDWGLHPQDAVNLPNIMATSDATVIVEKGPVGDTVAAALTGLGHKVTRIDLNSGVQAVLRRDGVWLGGADPRRDGAALGD